MVAYSSHFWASNVTPMSSIIKPVKPNPISQLLQKRCMVLVSNQGKITFYIADYLVSEPVWAIFGLLIWPPWVPLQKWWSLIPLYRFFKKELLNKSLDVSAWVSTVGIYAECYALSPEEPRHYNQHTSEIPAYKKSSLFLFIFNLRQSCECGL